MSIALPLVDLTTASVGTSGTVSFQQVGINSGGTSANPSALAKPAHLNVFNDSKNTLFIQFQTEGDSDNLPPGAWRTYSLIPGEAGLTWKVLSQMNVNAPISQLACTYYFPGEAVDNPGTLGNSPIGGGVLTTVAQTLSNEGSASGLLVIDIGDAAFAQLIAIFNDGHGTWAVDQSGVKHQVIKIQLAGNALQLGQAGDVTEVLGALTIDQQLTLSNPVTTVNGTSGTVTFSPVFWGAAGKMLIVSAVGYINNVIATFNFPSLLTRGWFFGGDFGSATPTFSLFNSTAQNETALTTLGGSSAGAGTVISSIHQDTLGTIINSVNQIQIGTTVAAINSSIILIGV